MSISMMKESSLSGRTFVISDTHFGHGNICKFTRQDGSYLRPWRDVDEMDKELIRRWNSVVSPGDTVYHLGDVVINRKALSILHHLNGRKILYKGNHDIFKLSDYTPYFEDIRSYRVIKTPSGKKCILSHIPIRFDEDDRFSLNIHGHLHHNVIPDDRYINVSVECIDYTPVELQLLLKDK